MDPVTHALAAVAVTQAGLRKTTRLALPIAVAAGLAAELDTLSVLTGANLYFHLNRRVTHSLLGSVVLAGLVAAAFWFADRKREKNPVCLRGALLVSFVAAGVHLFLDLCTAYGVQLLWPFSSWWFAWDLLDTVDPWVLLALVVGLLVPVLFRLVSEEIGARASARGAQRWAIATLLLLAAYLGARFYLHGQAVELLYAHVYHGGMPLRAAALPRATSPFEWHGIVVTENTLEEVRVPLGPGGRFDANRSRTHFKPEASPPLQAAQETQVFLKFLQFARFPIASVERIGEGFRVTARDLRFREDERASRRVLAAVETDNAARVTLSEYRFADEE